MYKRPKPKPQNARVDEEYLKLQNQTISLRTGPRISGYCAAMGLTATTFTWYRASASPLHSVTVALFVVPNLAILHYFTKFVHKYEVTLPITYKEVKDDKVILTSSYAQFLFGSAVPLLTASYPFIGTSWSKGKKAGLSLSRHVGVQLKNFFLGFSLRHSKRHYRILLVNGILQLGIGSLLGYQQVVERNLVEKRVFKDNEILPEYKDLFLNDSDLLALHKAYTSFVDRVERKIAVLFPPAK